jgi:hypothetical protein
MEGALGEALRTLGQSWQCAEDIDAAALADARAELHHALQLVADAGRKLADGGDTEYLAEARALATGVVRGTRPFRIALGVADFALLVTDRDGKLERHLPLAGQTLAQAVRWLRAEVEGRGADGQKLTGDAPYDLPDHKVADGAPFAAARGEAMRKLGAYFANAWRLLSLVSDAQAEGAPVRCSSESLDYGASISFDDGKQIDFGFRPGDEEHDEPYFYVALLPPPELDEDELEELEELEGGGEWATEGWFGGLLLGSAYTIYDSEAAQARAAASFFDSALEQARILLGVAEE